MQNCSSWALKKTAQRMERMLYRSSWTKREIEILQNLCTVRLHMLPRGTPAALRRTRLRQSLRCSMASRSRRRRPGCCGCTHSCHRGRKRFRRFPACAWGQRTAPSQRARRGETTRRVGTEGPNSAWRARSPRAYGRTTHQLLRRLPRRCSTEEAQPRGSCGEARSHEERWWDVMEVLRSDHRTRSFTGIFLGAN